LALARPYVPSSIMQKEAQAALTVALTVAQREPSAQDKLKKTEEQIDTIFRDFTEGNVPPGLLTAPEGWNVEQIRQFQEWFDSVLAGNTGARSRLVWAPSGTAYQAFTGAPYKDEFDEWLARIVCFAFSLPPTALVRQVNRATAETAQSAALAEGLAPLMGWVKRLVDHVIQDRMRQPDLEFCWVDPRPTDPTEQAKILDIYVRDGIYTVNEARDILGLDPVAGGERATMYSATGVMPRHGRAEFLSKYNPD
jgi:hypothetical protein